MNVLNILFYLAGLIAIVASIKVITRDNTVHALLYLVVSLLAIAVCFYLMGAPFAAGLEVIVYAGAILVMFVFAIMMFGLRNDELKYAPKNQKLGIWAGPSFLAFLLLIELIIAFDKAELTQNLNHHLVDAKQVGISLYSEYLLAVELASFLLLAGLVAAYHIAKPDVQGGSHD